MSIIKILKISFLYIGTVIGAGFATGKELVVFFKDTSFITIILGGIALGVFCSFYLYIGKVFSDDLSKVAFGKYYKIFDAIVLISIFFVLVAMFDTSEILLKQMLNISFGGYITIILTLLSAILGIGFIKRINFLVIPSIIVMVIVIFTKCPSLEVKGSVSFLPGIFYAGMNIMLAGYIIKPEGENLTNKQIILTGIFTSIMLSIVMVLLYEIVKDDNSIMPLLTIANKFNLIKVAGLITYFAILTTALSSASIIVENLSKVLTNKYLVALIVFLLAIPFKIFVGFDNIVNFVYPIVSVMGILVTIFSLYSLIKLKNSEKNTKFLKNK